MTASRLFLFPLSVSILFPVTFIFTFTLAVKKGHIYVFFSYISDTGALSPELCYFTQLLNIAAVLIGITAYIRYKQVEEVFLATKTNTASMQKANKAGLIFGMIAAFGVSVVGCFQETHIILGHVIGASMAFFGGSVFMIMQGYLTLHTMPMFGSRPLAIYRMINGFVCACLFITSLATGMVSLKQFKGDDSLLWEAEDGGWTMRVISTTTEWVMASLLDIFFLTFIPEFRRVAFQGPQFRITEVATVQSHQKTKNGTTTTAQQRVVMQRVEREESA